MTDLHDTFALPSSADLAGKIDDLRRFVDRRFAELSTEIHASTQLIDYSEENLSGQIGAMKEQIAAVLARPAAATRNSGVDLEAVVQTTEAAANRIMEAAEAIGDWLTEISDDPAVHARINDKVAAIFEACSFQDLTSQRIRRAIAHLHEVDAMLATMAGPAGAVAASPAQAAAPSVGADMAQAEIDRMLAG